MRSAVLTLAAATVAVTVAAQSPDPQPALQFEVAAVRQNQSADTRSSIRNEPGGRITITNNTLFNMVRNAYNVQPFQMVRGSGMPDWFERDRWDILAKAPEGTFAPPQLMVMLQNLLADRFTLVVTRETREMPVYALVMARADRQFGPNLRQSDGECEAARLAAQRSGGQAAPPQVERGFCGTRTSITNGLGTVSTSGIPMADFVRNLGPQTGRFVIDRTGLTGTFDMDLTFTPEQTIGDGADRSNPSLFAALQEQLGLRLEPQRGPVEVLVIESAERPTED